MYKTRCPFLGILLLIAATAASAGSAVPDGSSSAKPGSGQPRAFAKQIKARREQLSKEIGRILSDPQLQRSFWGVKAQSLATGQVLVDFNSEKLFTPASNTKLFTTAAALALIGADYKFRTTVETNGVLDHYGRIIGDLALVGRGDPNLSGRVLPYQFRAQRTLAPQWVLEELAEQLVQKGVKYVDGNIVGDDSFFAFERYGAGWAQEDAVWEWGAPVSALTLNDNSVAVRVQPAERPGERAFVEVTPFAQYLKIENQVVTTAPGTGPAKIIPNREPGTDEISIWGTIPADDPGMTYSLAINDPAEFAAQVFRNILLQRGIQVYGGVSTRHAELSAMTSASIAPVPGGGSASGAITPVQPLVLATHESRPLADDLRVINKDSQNLHAEIMLRLLGREKGAGGTIEAGAQVLKGFLNSAEIPPDQYVLLDGSGLSRQNLVTPNAVVQLLAYIDRQPWGNLFRESLPIAGVDGTLASRFQHSPCQGRVFAKTGMLEHVNALSGYAISLKGDRIAFSILANNQNIGSRPAIQVIDRIVEAIVNDLPAKSAKKN